MAEFPLPSTQTVIKSAGTWPSGWCPQACRHSSAASF